MTLTSTLTGIIAGLAAVAAGFLMGLPLLALAFIYPVAGSTAGLVSQWMLEQRERFSSPLPYFG